MEGEEGEEGTGATQAGSPRGSHRPRLNMLSWTYAREPEPQLNIVNTKFSLGRAAEELPLKKLLRLSQTRAK